MQAFKIISLVALFISNYCLNAQTSIEAGTGVRFSKVVGFSEDLPYYGIIPQNGFETRSPILNFGLVQNITTRLSLKAALQFGVQSVPYIDNGFVGWTDLRFDHYNFSFLPQYAVLNNMEIGLGINYGILSDFEYGKKDRNIWHPGGTSNNQNQFGWMTAVSYYFRPLIIAIQYNQMKQNRNEENKTVSQISSIEVLLNYQFGFGNK